jgi:hypothetical protein
MHPWCIQGNHLSRFVDEWVPLLLHPEEFWNSWAENWWESSIYPSKFSVSFEPQSEKVPEDLLKLRQGETSLPYCGQQLQKTAITTMIEQIREEEQILQILALKSGKLSWWKQCPTWPLSFKYWRRQVSKSSSPAAEAKCKLESPRTDSCSLAKGSRNSINPELAH